MKIQCNVCEGAEAKVLCCADEAALCWECDEKVHAANKLANKHPRVPLSTSSSHMPKCDICQVRRLFLLWFLLCFSLVGFSVLWIQFHVGMNYQFHFSLKSSKLYKQFLNF